MFIASLKYGRPRPPSMIWLVLIYTRFKYVLPSENSNISSEVVLFPGLRTTTALGTSPPSSLIPKTDASATFSCCSSISSNSSGDI